MAEEIKHIERFKLESNTYPIWDTEFRDDVPKTYYNKDEIDAKLNQVNNDINNLENKSSNNLEEFIEDQNSTNTTVNDRLDTLENESHKVIYVKSKESGIWTLGEVDING